MFSYVEQQSSVPLLWYLCGHKSLLCLSIFLFFVSPRRHSDHFMLWSGNQRRKEMVDHLFSSPCGTVLHKTWHSHKHLQLSFICTLKCVYDHLCLHLSPYKFFTAKFQKVPFAISLWLCMPHSVYPLSTLTNDTKSNGKVQAHIFVARGDAGKIRDPHQVSSLMLLNEEVLSL